MNYETKAVLFRICQALRDVEDRLHYAEMMGWETYMAAGRLLPGFVGAAKAHEGVSFEQLDKTHDEVHQALDQILGLLRPN